MPYLIGVLIMKTFDYIPTTNAYIQAVPDGKRAGHPAM